MKTEVLTHTASRMAGQAGEAETDSHSLAGKTAVTILLAIAFLALVMCLSYLFIAGTR